MPAHEPATGGTAMPDHDQPGHVCAPDEPLLDELEANAVLAELPPIAEEEEHDGDT